MIGMIDVRAYIEVPDLERGIAFYRDGLGSLGYPPGFGSHLYESGLQQQDRSTTNHTVAFSAGGISVCLIRPPSAKRGVRPRKGRQPTYLEFTVYDLEATIGRLIALGGTCEGPVKRYGDRRLAHMTDPFGNWFDLQETARPMAPWLL
jgi:predicted enzyme related to lactoylglutathione lyase